MRKLAVVLSLLFAVSLSAEEVLDNAAVLKLLDAGLAPDIIQMKIEQSATSFDVTTDGLIALQKANVPDLVIKAMLRKSAMDERSTPRSPATPAVPAASPDPSRPARADELCLKASYYTSGVNGWSWYPANVCVTSSIVSIDDADIPLGELTAHCLLRPFAINIGGRTARGEQEWHFGAGQDLYELRGPADDMRRLYDSLTRMHPEIKHGEDCGAADIRRVLMRK